jgi:hypothetical protein
MYALPGSSSCCSLGALAFRATSNALARQGHAGVTGASSLLGRVGFPSFLRYFEHCASIGRTSASRRWEGSAQAASALH